jgi:hypothetical protein
MKILLNFFTEKNSRIYLRTKKDGVWTVKGRFDRAVQLKERVPWMQEDGLFTSILIVS